MYSLNSSWLTHSFNLSQAMRCVLHALFLVHTIYHCAILPYAKLTFAQYFDLYGKSHQTFSIFLVLFRYVHTNNKCCCFSYQTNLPSDNRISTLFSISNSCLYAAKSAGRNRWVGIVYMMQPSSLPLANTIEALQSLDNQDAISYPFLSKSSAFF